MIVDFWGRGEMFRGRFDLDSVLAEREYIEVFPSIAAIMPEWRDCRQQACMGLYRPTLPLPLLAC